MTSRSVDSEYRRKRLRPACLCRCGSGRADRGGDDASAEKRAGANAPSSPFSRACRRPDHGHRSIVTSASPSTTPRGGSCGRRCRAARRAARPPPGFSASSRKQRSTTRTSMTTPTCRTCNASRGQASPPWRRPAGASGVHGCIRLPFDFADAVRRDHDGHSGDRGASDVAPSKSLIRCCSSRSPVRPPWPTPAPQKRKKRRGKRPKRESPPGRPPGGDAGQGAGSRGGNLKRRAEAQLAAVETRAWLRHLGGGKGAGRGRQGAGRRQDRRVAAAMGRRQCGSATEARCRHVCA